LKISASFVSTFDLLAACNTLLSPQKYVRSFLDLGKIFENI
jgi:hypothetical protein